MNVEVHATTMSDVFELHSAIDQVAREERWLGASRALPLTQMEAFVQGLLDAGEPHYVAVAGAAVVGWCDVARYPADSRRHCGRLGMGLLENWRGRGLGRRLLTAALAHADAIPLDRVELDVVADNQTAIGLYDRMGFAREGVRKGAWRLGGVTRDMVVMGRRNPQMG